MRVEDSDHCGGDGEEETSDAEPENDWGDVIEDELKRGDEKLGGVGVGWSEGFEDELEERSDNCERGETEENAEDSGVYDERGVGLCGYF